LTLLGGPTYSKASKTGCPRNLYYLIKSYLNQRFAVLSTYSIKMERDIEVFLKGRAAVRGYGISNKIDYYI
jgi:hypothetical protein